MEEPSRRFDSWKEIAAHFERDVRTVRRWERQEGLPVHRHLHRSRGSVYAFQSELDRWHARRSLPGAPRADRRRPSLRAFVLLAAFAAIGGLGGWRLHRSVVSARSSVSSAAGAAAPRRVDVIDTRQLADPSARQDFLVARHQLDRRSGFRREARELLETTTRRAPDFAAGHALLAEAYLREALFDHSRRAEAWARAEAAVRRALALDDNLALAHGVLSRIRLLLDWDWSAADAESRRAIELDPESPGPRSARALYLRAAGRMSEAIAERQRAQRADPTNPQWQVFLGDDYVFARQYEHALGAYSRALELERDYRLAVAGLADAYARLDRHADAAAWQSRWLVLSGRQEVAAGFDDVRRREGPRAALEWLERWNLREFERAQDEHLWDLAYLHARLGNREASLEFLERARGEHAAGLLQARVDPDFDALRSDPRFHQLLGRIGPP